MRKQGVAPEGLTRRSRSLYRFWPFPLPFAEILLGASNCLHSITKRALGVSFKMGKRREVGKESRMTYRRSAMPHA
jgi:hypothetical protein